MRNVPTIARPGLICLYLASTMEYKNEEISMKRYYNEKKILSNTTYKLTITNESKSIKVKVS